MTGRRTDTIKPIVAAPDAFETLAAELSLQRNNPKGDGACPNANARAIAAPNRALSLPDAFKGAKRAKVFDALALQNGAAGIEADIEEIRAAVDDRRRLGKEHSSPPRASSRNVSRPIRTAL
jgi:hypothetical protein